MNLINWDKKNPLSSLTHIQHEMSDLLDFLSSAHQTENYISAEFPQIIVSINEGNIIVRAELPGVKTADLNIQVVDEVLTIKGERKPATETQKINYLRRERDYGTFARSIMLPERVDIEKVAASYKNGVLTVKLPKSAEAKPKQIEIKRV
ncbi:MAG: Hsp20/alpha crystallin family protein [Candidatus Jettenia sp.]|uniref:Heat shock protein Hsp20 n=1 Tax=Candidatus Jettenia caeni TaxID=247490 RepID=I3IHT7_9BACT|nr:Hsp20/alpha crystallin family protein [Candidatus Jettenia sp. AMX1]MBC6930033.1 Hsp20/alpha crystallin family protein [Candidatus Jettenia sp.]NUN23251.1 Hsp20/alpha crystallin family protein [Candidatus Jettenia caeni]KAA0248326.1 MAG: Hsp20/alpha crystallin family protein [Candidatus Jettenia sp. AMX1]MCE7881689.1 Hsp20/alpha crystallin family protein [Candidatus Jettenia sp. AMX1]MCQ3928329.1 Hsp20/alpha crystallin family protein [Candidatus Jettenia sp.]